MDLFCQSVAIRFFAPRLFDKMVFFLFFLSKLQLRKKCRICQTKSFLGRIIVVHPLPLSAGGVSDTDYTSLPNLYETVQIEKERERERGLLRDSVDKTSQCVFE